MDEKQIMIEQTKFANILSTLGIETVAEVVGYMEHTDFHIVTNIGEVSFVFAPKETPENSEKIDAQVNFLKQNSPQAIFVLLAEELMEKNNVNNMFDLVDLIRKGRNSYDKYPKDRKQN